MRTCGYCGHEEAEEAVHCSGCGTEFTNQPAKAEHEERSPRDWSWLKTALLYMAICFGALFLYLLSLGPVMRYWGQITPTRTTAPSRTTTQEIKFQSWIGVVYAPAFLLISSPLGDVYLGYLEWWQRPAP